MPMPPASPAFSELLQQARAAAGLSRVALAQRVGLDPSHVYRMETGGRRPSREAALALAEALGVQGEDVNTWLVAAGYAPLPLLPRVRGAVRTRGRGHSPAITPTPASAWDTALWARWLEAMGLQEATIGQLLQGLESAGMQERHAVTQAVGTTFARLIERLEVPVRTAVIPAAGGQHRLLAQHVIQLLVLRAIREAVESGIGQVILILPAGLGELLYAPLKAALELAVVPPIALHYCEQARPEGLGDALLQAEPLLGEEPFAVLLPDDMVRERIGRTVYAWELRRMMEALRQVPEAHLVAVTAVPRSKMSQGGVVQVAPREVGPALRPIVRLVEKPPPGERIYRAPRVLGIVGRYLVQPAIFGPLHALQAAGQRPLHLTEALERLRQAGQSIYAFELAGAREDLGHVLGEASALIDASADPAAPS